MKPAPVAVIGAGMIGRSWAVTCARGECAMRLYDPHAGARDSAVAAIASTLAELATHGWLHSWSATLLVVDGLGTTGREELRYAGIGNAT